MRIELYAANSTANKDAIEITEGCHAIDLKSNRPVPRIFIDADEVEEQSKVTTGAQVVEIFIKGPRGTAKFWIDARLMRGDKPQLHIATNVDRGTNTKKLAGEWRA